jgi:hypothetical protein
MLQQSGSSTRVGQLLTQFPRPSPVRSIAESLLGNSLQPDTCVRPLFSALESGPSRNWREKVVAAWALARVPLDTVERDAAGAMLLETLERDDDDTLWERFLRGLLWGYGTMLPLCLAWSVLLCSIGGNLVWADVFPQMLLAIGSVASIVTIPVCVVYGGLNNNHVDALRAAAAESLGRMRVVDSIGPLAERLFDRSPAVREAAASALMELLPDLEEADYGTIDQRSLARLAEALDHWNTLLVFKILDALKMVGTGAALAAVERVSREGKTRLLKDTAREVAAVLEDRRRREHEAAHLMRPTSGPEHDGQTSSLLRATGSYDYDTEDAVQRNGLNAAGGQEWL